MIAYLSGKSILFDEDFLVLEVNGVGYEVHLPQAVLRQLESEQASQISLHIYTVVREDALQLYGFIHLEDKNIFLKLISVSGVGPKLAMTILSGISSAQLIEAISSDDLARLTSISGIGKKTAERLILELKDKFKHLKQDFSVKTQKISSPLQDDLLSALLHLGYKQQEIEKKLSTANLDWNAPFEILIKDALKLLSKKS